MTIPINVGKFFNNQYIKDTLRKTSRSVKFVGVSGAIFYLLASTHSGIYSIEIKLFDAWHLLAEGTCPAGTLTTVDVEFYFPEARVSFQADTPEGSFSAQVFGYPAVYTREAQGDLY